MDPSVILLQPALALAVAMVIDAVLGGPRLLGRMPGPDLSITHILDVAVTRLDRAERTKGVRRLRGLVVLFAVALAAGSVGFLIDYWAGRSAYGAAFHLLTISFLLGARIALATVRELARRMAAVPDSGTEQQKEDRFEAGRWAVERLANRYGDGIWANIIWYLLAGLPGVLVYRTVANMAAIAAPRGVRPSDNPFFSGAEIAYAAMSFVPGVFAALFIHLASLAFPWPRGRASAPLFALEHESVVPLRLLVVRALATALGVVVRDTNGGGWIGAKEGRARLNAADVRHAGYLFILAWFLVFLVMALLAVFSLQ